MMYLLWIYFYFFLILSAIFLFFILIMLNYILTELNFLKEKNKLFLYECGYDSVYWSHNKVSLHFFKIGLIFVLFDLEIMFFLLMFFNSLNFFILWFLFLFILSTLFIEMSIKSFLWFY